MNDIAAWIKKMAAPNNFIYAIKFLLYVAFPFLGLVTLSIFWKSKANKILNDWFAIDIYPEYSYEIKNIVEFIGKMFYNNDAILPNRK